MLKGKSTIQVFDALTGEEKLCVKNKNIVTNAVSRLLNPPSKWGFAGSYSQLNAAVNYITPVASKALGGIMLWESTIAENANNMLPPTDNFMVGHAGVAYSGTKASRGSYNASESGAISGGYRHVWDFGTDRANGTINCLTLTSVDGGNTGIYPSTDGNGVFIFPSQLGNGTVVSSPRIYPAGLMLPNLITDINLSKCAGRLSGDRYMICTKVSGVYTMYIIKAPSGTALSLTTDFSGKTSANSVVASYQLSGYPLTFSVLDDSTFVYIYSYNASQVILKKCSVADGTLIDTITLSLSGSEYSFSMNNVDTSKSGSQIVFYNNSWYIGDYFYVFRFSPTGTFMNAISTTLCGYWHNLSVFNDTLFATQPTSSSSGSNSMVIAKDNTITPFKMRMDGAYPKFPIFDACPHYPYVLCTSLDNDGTNVTSAVGPLDMMIHSTYLGTINNLTASITKTATQTMKITYELYDE